jgi:nucleotide-binding universal stress UspA family protein
VSKDVYVVAYEGDDKTVVQYAAEKAKKDGSSLHIVHVLEWSPYSFLTPEELEERHRRRKDEMKRAHDIVLAPVMKDLADQGVSAECEIRYGNVVDLLIEIATNRKAAMIFVGRARGSAFSNRVFGSVPLGLAQSTPVPLVIVP